MFKSSACLQMHVRRRHEGKSLSVNNDEKRVYYCPVENCDRRKGKENPFPRLGQLKQHYQSVHSEKKFRCQKCDKLFGLRDVCRRHEAECGQQFKCASCDETFRSRNALYQHAKRKHHATSESPKLQLSFNPPAATVIEQRVPQIRINDATAQTSDTLCEQSSSVSTDEPLFASSGCQTLDCAFDLGIHSKDISTVLLSFTPDKGRTSLEATSQSCQTQSLDSSEFGTQTSFPLEYLLGSDFGIRTLENIGASKLEDYTELDLNTLLPPGCLSFGTQTSFENMVDCLEFGVQTLMQTETKDQESQTTHSA
eukprot:Em0018g994a